MIKFDSNYFQKFSFTKEQLKSYFGSAQKNLKIAEESNTPEVIFKFSYDALIKLGITLIAYRGYKVRSILGHHIKILEAMGKLLKNPDVEAIGNMMRKQRNFDLYDEGLIISKKQSKEYLEFISGIFNKWKKNFYE